jgi:hypothetical protein
MRLAMKIVKASKIGKLTSRMMMTMLLKKEMAYENWGGKS